MPDALFFFTIKKIATHSDRKPHLPDKLRDCLKVHDLTTLNFKYNKNIFPVNFQFPVWRVCRSVAEFSPANVYLPSEIIFVQSPTFALKKFCPVFWTKSKCYCTKFWTRLF